MLPENVLKQIVTEPLCATETIVPTEIHPHRLRASRIGAATQRASTEQPAEEPASHLQRDRHAHLSAASLPYAAYTSRRESSLHAGRRLSHRSYPAGPQQPLRAQTALASTPPQIQEE